MRKGELLKLNCNKNEQNAGKSAEIVSSKKTLPKREDCRAVG
jgi:hypothetical protein